MVKLSMGEMEHQINGALIMTALSQKPYEEAVAESYKKWGYSLEEILIRLYGERVSEQRLGRVTEALLGEKLTLDELRNLNETICKHIEKWRNRLLSDEYPYVYLTRVYPKRGSDDKTEKLPVLVALGVNTSGYREIVGVCKATGGETGSWLNFMRHLKNRGLSGAKLFVSDDYPGLPPALGKVFPDAKYQRCIVNFNLCMFHVTPVAKVKAVAMLLGEVYAQKDQESALAKAKETAAVLREMDLKEAGDLLEKSAENILSYMLFPEEHQNRLRTDNTLERAMLELLRRSNKTDAFPDDHTAVMSICAGLRHIPYTNWKKRYMNMEKPVDSESLPSVS